MSIVLCVICLNVGVVLGMVLSATVREQRAALAGQPRVRAP